VQHRHGRLVGTGLAPAAVLGRLLQRAGDAPGIAPGEDAALEVERVAALHEPADQYLRLVFALVLRLAGARRALRFAFGAMGGSGSAARRRRRDRRAIAARTAVPGRRLADLLADLAREVERFAVLVGAAQPLRLVDLDAQRRLGGGLGMLGEQALRRID